jgi:hypothetical protein
VSLQLAGSPIVSFPLGTLPGSPNGYVLAVPMDALETRTAGTARQDDAAQLLLDGSAVAAVTIGERGGTQTRDLALTAPHEIVLIRGPTALPTTTAAGGMVYLDVAAADTEGGHTLGYGWSSACPGPDEGAFDNPLSRTPAWTAPAAGGSPGCTLSVTISDGQGLAVVSSTVVAVLPSVTPHEIVLIGGPTAMPSSTAAGGTVYLDVAAADTEGGHTLSYTWSSACPGPDKGAFDNPLSRTPAWTAPAAGGSPGCTLSVTISDGHGLVLEPSTVVAVFPPTAGADPVAQIQVSPDPLLCGAPISFDGSASYAGEPGRSIALYEWDFDYDGAIFDVQATGVTAVHGYGSRATPVTVALRVSDDGSPPRSAIAALVVHPGGANRAPAADAGGPYGAASGVALTLDGQGSTDPDAACGDGIAAWAWDLDGDGAHDDAAGPQPLLSWDEIEALICGGRCAEGQSYAIGLQVTDARGASAVAPAAVAVSLLIFADTFADGGPQGDPEWQVRSGAWTVIGKAPTARYYASSPTKGGLSVAAAPALGSLPSGGLLTRISITKSFAKYANGALVFGYTDNAHYRYVRLQLQKGVWKLVLGQSGGIGPDRAGTKASKTLKGLKLGRWYRLWLDVYDDGRVNVFFKARTAVPTIAYRFQAAAPGQVGYQAAKARAYFDDFEAWDRGVLP